MFVTLDFGKFKTDVNSKNSLPGESFHPVDDVTDRVSNKKLKEVSVQNTAKAQGMLLLFCSMNLLYFYYVK